MDIRIQTPDPTYIYYPGLCLSQKAAKADQAITREPSLIIELITPTTERLILHEKSINYQRIPSLQQIIYIWPHLKTAHVDFRDVAGSKWTRKYYTIDEKIPLAQSIGNGELVLADIFHHMVSDPRSNFLVVYQYHLIDFNSSFEQCNLIAYNRDSSSVDCLIKLLRRQSITRSSIVPNDHLGICTENNIFCPSM